MSAARVHHRVQTMLLTAGGALVALYVLAPFSWMVLTSFLHEQDVPLGAAGHRVAQLHAAELPVLRARLRHHRGGRQPGRREHAAGDPRIR